MSGKVRKVVERTKARQGYLVKLECGSKRYTKSKGAKKLKCESKACKCED
jgi:hypothetical protein